ncbi:hypothetical protein C2857_001333 [Epichloe festucae Fl1]|uniref:Uncharacterized protein n=1 Tax=Epichloe festucae (strain Fl1) TaxID=877507 RepID=A0A7U3Q1F4_EPIFF|nr:hypothetical protein C2857_001333 [Epichloe festucae Fl1]
MDLSNSPKFPQMFGDLVTGRGITAYDYLDFAGLFGSSIQYLPPVYGACAKMVLGEATQVSLLRRAGRGSLILGRDLTRPTWVPEKRTTSLDMMLNVTIGFLSSSDMVPEKEEATEALSEWTEVDSINHMVQAH